jgi:3-hydroxyacyl-CoA dehydrogenase
VEAIIAAERQAAGLPPREFSDEEIVTRYMTAMANEGARVVQDGIALRPIDVDAVFLFGYGFPRHLGGPLNYADQIGLDRMLADTERFAEEDDFYWRQPELMKRLAANGDNFASLND